MQYQFLIDREKKRQAEKQAVSRKVQPLVRPEKDRVIEKALRNLKTGDDNMCVFCGIGIEDDEAMAAGPTTDYGNCCSRCFNLWVLNHQNPEIDILAESNKRI